MCVVLACVRVHIVCWLTVFAGVRVCTLHWSRDLDCIVAVIGECISIVLRFSEVTRNSDQSEVFFVDPKIFQHLFSTKWYLPIPQESNRLATSGYVGHSKDISPGICN